HAALQQLVEAQAVDVQQFRVRTAGRHALTLRLRAHDPRARAVVGKQEWVTDGDRELVAECGARHGVAVKQQSRHPARLSPVAAIARRQGRQGGPGRALRRSTAIRRSATSAVSWVYKARTEREVNAMKRLAKLLAAVMGVGCVLAAVAAAASAPTVAARNAVEVSN